MKQMTPLLEWIGFLIGIVIVGRFLGHVTATSVLCYPVANGVTDVDEMNKIISEANKAARTCSATDKCLQYIAPGSGGLKVELTIECAAGCPSDDDIKKKFKGLPYTCHSTCNNGGTGCKTVADIKSSAVECYDYVGKRLLKSEALPKRVYCIGGCNTFPYTADTRTGNDVGAGVFMGCKIDGDALKANPKITSNEALATCTDIATDCKPKLVMEVGCWKTTSPALTSVKLIKEAMSDGKSHDCGSGKRCLLFTPPAAAGERKGKVHLMIKCSSGSTDCPVENLGGINYDCNACERGVASKSCKSLSDITGSTQCYDYPSSDKKPDFTTIEKVYCMDKCQYSIGIDFSDKTTYFLGCASDCDNFKTGKKSATCTDCTNDAECQKIVGDATTKRPDGSNPDQNQATTKPIKHGNKLTGPTYLIGSMAILIYAASQNIRQF